jgi:hypothetical protein
LKKNRKSAGGLLALFAFSACSLDFERSSGRNLSLRDFASLSSEKLSRAAIISITEVNSK